MNWNVYRGIVMMTSILLRLGYEPEQIAALPTKEALRIITVQLNAMGYTDEQLKTMDMADGYRILTEAGWNL